MSAAKKCDRCGDYYTTTNGPDDPELKIYKQTASVNGKEAILELMYRRPGESYQAFLDLCPRCQRSLLHWFSNERYADD